MLTAERWPIPIQYPTRTTVPVSNLFDNENIHSFSESFINPFVAKVSSVHTITNPSTIQPSPSYSPLFSTHRESLVQIISTLGLNQNERLIGFLLSDSQLWFDFSCVKFCLSWCGIKGVNQRRKPSVNCKKNKNKPTKKTKTTQQPTHSPHTKHIKKKKKKNLF